MRIFVDGGDAFEQAIVAETIEAIARSKSPVTRLVVQDSTWGAGQTAVDWAREQEIPVVETAQYLLELPDAAILFPGTSHKPFRAFMQAGIPVYRVTPEGRFTKY